MGVVALLAAPIGVVAVARVWRSKQRHYIVSVNDNVETTVNGTTNPGY